MLTKGTVKLEARSEHMAASTRYDYEASNQASGKLQRALRGMWVRKFLRLKVRQVHAATVLQSGHRGARVRTQVKQQQQGKAATKVQALIRRKSAYKIKKYRELELAGWGGVFFIATKKPLICRATWELKSDKVAEVAPETRVVVNDIYTMSDGVVRAQIRLEDDPAPLGWLTASKYGANSLWPALPKADLEDDDDM